MGFELGMTLPEATCIPTRASAAAWTLVDRRPEIPRQWNPQIPFPTTEQQSPGTSRYQRVTERSGQTPHLLSGVLIGFVP